MASLPCHLQLPAVGESPAAASPSRAAVRPARTSLQRRRGWRVARYCLSLSRPVLCGWTIVCFSVCLFLLLKVFELFPVSASYG